MSQTSSRPKRVRSEPSPPGSLRDAVAGVRAFILDADGVLMYRNAPIPGSPEALLELRRRRIPYRVVTNFSSAHRSSLATAFGKAAGIPVDGAEIITAASAAAAYTAEHHPGAPLLIIAADDAAREWAGQQLRSPDEADAAHAAHPKDVVGAVVIGDGGDSLSYRNLDIAYRQCHAGAELIAMHRNPWWMTPRGYTLDAGAFVAGLEFSLGRRAVVCGKPSPVVFRQALSELRGELAARDDGSGGPRLRAADVAMVGDDPRADIAAARRVGLRGILVLSGKVEAASAADGNGGAIGVAPNLAAVIDQLS